MKIAQYSVVIFKPSENEWVSADSEMPFYSIQIGDKFINYEEQEIYKVIEIYHDIRETGEHYYHLLKVMTEFVEKVPS